MNITQIETNLQNISFEEDSFIYDLLLAYGNPKASIKKLQLGSLNLSKTEGEILWKKKLYYKVVHDADLHHVIDDLKTDNATLKSDPRFLIVTDFDTLLAIDRKTNDTLDIPIRDIAKYHDFFLPWAGMEKTQYQNENPADVKAAVKMARLYDEIKKENTTKTPEEIHNLNVFLSRLLFCFFAEDTGIFDKGQFTNAIASHTQADGSDLGEYLDKLFEVFNTDRPERESLPSYLDAFPYVNGGLFGTQHTAPKFNAISRKAIIEAGTLDWSEINPDIFGSMFQAVIDPEERSGMGMHYTSVPNIMKVIEPLFLNELYEEFEQGRYEPDKLNKLLERLGRIKIFDPACGSGNFLIIAYKELRTLEINILKQLQELSQIASGFEPKQLELIPKAQLRLAKAYQPSFFTRVELTNFYGIELDDFAHEIAILSLWLAQHQMNMKFKAVFGSANPTLPLRQGGNITCGNATRLDWEQVCPKQKDDEIYILGNPPYLGGKGQSNEQKTDLEITFKGNKNFKELDYIACWFLLASKYIADNSKYAFVTTSSLCEGAQVEQMWPLVSSLNNEIYFAYRPFEWTNNAKSKAAVTCSIIGVRKKSSGDKFIYNGLLKQKVSRINGYLTSGSEIYITKSLSSISGLPTILTGNSPYENGNLMLTPIEKNDLLQKDSRAKLFIRRVTGANEFINNIERYCLWIDDSNLDIALSIPDVRERIDRIKKFRAEGGEVARNLLNRPHQFRYTHTAKQSLIIIPIVSSSRREYIPMGILSSDYIILSSAAAIYDSETYVFAVISSRIHMLWVRLTSGKLRGDIRYLSALSYNTFPFPVISEMQKEELLKHTYRVLSERELHSEKTLAQLYDPETMPEGLREAHHQLDLAVERCYRTKPFESDEERLEYLFKLYEKMIAEEKEKGTLFQTEPKAKKKTKTK